MSDTERLSTKTERALEALGEGMTSRPNQRPAASPSQRPKEKVGAGTDYAAENRKRLGAQLKAKIKKALTYPTAVVVVAIVVTAIFFGTLVVAKRESLFD